MDHHTVTSRWSIELNYALARIIKQEVEDESIGELPEAKSASCCCCERCSECDCPECTGELLLKGERLDGDTETVVLKDEETKQEWFSPPNTPELGPEWDDDDEDDRFSEALKTPAYVPSFYDDEDEEGGEDDNAAAEPTQKRPFSPEVHEFAPNLNQAKPTSTSYQCTVSGSSRVFQSQSAFCQHKAVHSGKYTCQQCDKSCPSNTKLKLHQLKHSGEKPHQCSECSRAFAHKSALIRHHRTHSGEKPYQCTQCDRSFARSGNLTVHMRVHSGEKPFQCTQCDKSFTTNSHLTVHLRVHTHDRPYKCTHCSFASAQKGQLTTHLRLHSDQLPFQCEQCMKRFNRKHQLTSHMRNKH